MEENGNKVNENDDYCLPTIKTTFNPRDIVSEGCDGNKNKFKVTGYWDNEREVSSKNEMFKMPLSSQEGKKADCSFNNYEQFTCLFEGYGKIKFDTFNFKSVLSPYKVNGLDKSINVTECISQKGNHYYYIKTKILEILFLCLFLV